MGYEEDLWRSVTDITSGAAPAYMKSDVMIGSREVEREAVKGSVQGTQMSGGLSRPLDLVAADSFKRFATDWELRCSLLTGDGGFRYMHPIVDSVAVSKNAFMNLPMFPVIGHYGLIRAELVSVPTAALQKLAKERPGVFGIPPDALQVLLGWRVPCYVYDGGMPPDGADTLERGGVFSVNVITNPMGRILRCPGGRPRDDSIEESDPSMFFAVASLIAKVGARVAGKMIKSLIRRASVKLDERAAMRAVAELEREELEAFASAQARWVRGEAEVLKADLTRRSAVYVRRSGIAPKHYKAFLDAARETNAVVLVRNGKEAAIPLIERGCPGKPKIFEPFNTDPNTGILTTTDPTHRALIFQNKYILVNEQGIPQRMLANGTLENVAIKDPFWKLEPGQVIDPVLQKPVVGDYDLMGVYETSNPGQNATLAFRNRGEIVENRTSPVVEKVTENVNKKFDMNRVLHGAQDQYRGFRGGATAFFPDGTALYMDTQQEVEAFYDAIKRQPITGAYPQPGPNVPIPPDITPITRGRR
jgi:hypothetical protein